MRIHCLPTPQSLIPPSPSEEEAKSQTHKGKPLWGAKQKAGIHSQNWVYTFQFLDFSGHDLVFQAIFCFYNFISAQCEFLALVSPPTTPFHSHFVFMLRLGCFFVLYPETQDPGSYPCQIVTNLGFPETENDLDTTRDTHGLDSWIAKY